MQPFPATPMMPQNAGPAMVVDRNNLTHLDIFTNTNDGVSARGNHLFVEFFYARVRVGLEGSQRPETRLYVALQPRGDRLTRAIEEITEAAAQRRFPAEWQAFKTYQDTPTTGTPLHELPGITVSMIGLVMLYGLRSVEDLAETPAEVVNQIGIEASTAQKIAIDWLSRKRGSQDKIDHIERESELEAELKALREQNRILKENAAVAEKALAAVQNARPEMLAPVVGPVPSMAAAGATVAGMVDDGLGDGSNMPPIFGPATVGAEGLVNPLEE